MACWATRFGAIWGIIFGLTSVPATGADEPVAKNTWRKLAAQQQRLDEELGRLVRARKTRRCGLDCRKMGLVSMFTVLGPFVHAYLVSLTLRSCSNPAVVKLLNELIHKTAVGSNAISIDGYREVGYDLTAKHREGECLVHCEEADFKVTFFVEWQNQVDHRFVVRTQRLDVLLCTNPEVTRLVEKIIRGTAAGRKVTSIDGYQEISYDRKANVRKGRCVLHGKGEVCDLFYAVEWRDQKNGRFQVRLVAK